MVFFNNFFCFEFNVLSSKRETILEPFNLGFKLPPVIEFDFPLSYHVLEFVPHVIEQLFPIRIRSHEFSLRIDCQAVNEVA